MINYYVEDVYTEDKLSKMSLAKKRKLALEKVMWAVNVYLRDKKFSEYADTDYIKNYIKVKADEESLDNILISKFANEDCLLNALITEKFKGEFED